MTYGLPEWFLVILSIAFVLGPLLGGIGAILATRNGKKVDELHILMNGQTAERLRQAFDHGKAEGKASAPLVIVPPIVAPGVPTVIQSPTTGSDSPENGGT